MQQQGLAFAATLVWESGWPIKLMYPMALLAYAQPWAQLRALAALSNLEIQFAGQ